MKPSEAIRRSYNTLPQQSRTIMYQKDLKGNVTAACVLGHFCRGSYTQYFDPRRELGDPVLASLDREYKPGPNLLQQYSTYFKVRYNKDLIDRPALSSVLIGLNDNAQVTIPELIQLLESDGM